jgi:hypothetical protein
MEFDVKNPAILREQAVQYAKRLRLMRPYMFPKKTDSWYRQLHDALNANETLEALNKPAMDQDD